MTEQLREWQRVADQFGVDMEQVRRDHLISHVLAAISAHAPTSDGCSSGARRCHAPTYPMRG